MMRCSFFHAISRRLCAIAVFTYVWPVPAAYAQHDHEHGSPPADNVSTLQMLVFVGALLVVLRTVRDIVRGRPWAQEPNAPEYELVRKARAWRQMGGLGLGILLGFGLFSVFDARLHELPTGQLEDPRTAAARARVEAMAPDEHDMAILEALAADAPTPESVDEHAGHEHAPGEHEATAADAHDHAEGGETFHRLLFATLGGALLSLVALVLPVKVPRTTENADA